ncbi:MAG TPA: response regulator [Caulobacteraceae bacterium]|nr:response regulator [Caulobacteraceae bacterium]
MGTADFQQPCAAGSTRPVVLIVEDEVLIRLLLAEALRNAGYEVLEAADADEALSVLQTMPSPDVLVTDVRMPGAMDGLQLASHVRGMKPTLGLIVTSGHAPAERAIGLADAFVPKPYDLGRIVGVVRGLAPTS